MSFRPALPEDRPAIEAFLAAHADSSMFPLSNLAAHGMAGGHPRAMRFWVGPGAVLGVTEGGMVMPQVPPALAPAAARAIRGRPVAGVIGESAQVAALVDALGIEESDVLRDAREPHMALDLADLALPATEGLAIEPWAEARRPLLVAWREAFGREVLGWGDREAGQAEADVAMALAADSHRVLLREEAPAASTGFNARLPHIVQVGGVWTPPENRGRGHARAAVGLHLAEARAGGARRAVLCAASEMAARAYRALGFAEIGRFTILTLRGPMTAGARGG